MSQESKVQIESCELQAFALLALRIGREKYATLTPDERIYIDTGTTTFRFGESSPSLMQSITHCLRKKTVDSKERNENYALFGDYSGWHVNERINILLAQISPSEIETRLACIGIKAIYNSDRVSWDILDTRTKFGVRLLRGAADIPVWELSSPLSFFSKWMAEADGKCMLHAGSLALNGKGALVIGNGGAGKSGTVLGAMKNGFSSSGDDYVLVSNQAPYMAYAVNRTVKQDINGLKRLGLNLDMPLNWQNKAVFRPELVLNREIADMVPIHVLLSPSLGGKTTTFKQIKSSAVFKTLTLSTLQQICGSYASTFQVCANLIRDLPSYEVNLSADNNEISDALAHFLGTL